MKEVHLLSGMASWLREREGGKEKRAVESCAANIYVQVVAKAASRRSAAKALARGARWRSALRAEPEKRNE